MTSAGPAIPARDYRRGWPLGPKGWVLRGAVGFLVGGFLLPLTCRASAPAVAPKKVANPLELRISLEASSVTEPRPARVKLEFKNIGDQTLWLYHPVRRAGPGSRLSNAGDASSLKVNLTPAGNRRAQSRPGASGVVSAIGVPHPKLFRVPPGGEASEDVLLHLSPARAESQGMRNPLWGAYQLSVIYRARFSNQADILKETGLKLWNGKIGSNTVPVTLAASGGQGSIKGAVANSISQPLPNSIVTLATAHEDPLDETRTDAGGNFAFRNLPWGLYWAFARQRSRRTENLVYRHAVLSAAAPTARLELMLIPKPAYNAKRLMRKPVLLRAVGGSGQPLSGVRIEALFANGRVVETIEGLTGPDGTLALGLIPGRNIITLRRPGCRSKVRLANVSYGAGVDGFEFHFACRKK